MPQSIPVSQQPWFVNLRWRVIRRDRERCQYCGGVGAFIDDWESPLARGESSWVCCCRHCWRDLRSADISRGNFEIRKFSLVIERSRREETALSPISKREVRGPRRYHPQVGEMIITVDGEIGRITRWTREDNRHQIHYKIMGPNEKESEWMAISRIMGYMDGVESRAEMVK